MNFGQIWRSTETLAIQACLLTHFLFTAFATVLFLGSLEATTSLLYSRLMYLPWSSPLSCDLSNQRKVSSAALKSFPRMLHGTQIRFHCMRKYFELALEVLIVPRRVAYRLSSIESTALLIQPSLGFDCGLPQPI